MVLLLREPPPEWAAGGAKCVGLVESVDDPDIFHGHDDEGPDVDLALAICNGTL